MTKHTILTNPFRNSVINSSHFAQMVQFIIQGKFPPSACAPGARFYPGKVSVTCIECNYMALFSVALRRRFLGEQP